MTTINDVLSQLEKVKQNGDGYMACCPVPGHDDHNPSLSIKQGDNGKLLLKCFAGCSYPDIAKALGLDKVEAKTQKRVVAEYYFTDEAGEVLYKKLRYSDKTFAFRVPDGAGWGYKLNGCRRVLYNLPDVIKSGLVYLVEGEKDADTLKRQSYIATTTDTGASKDGQKPKWNTADNGFFRDKVVFILPDNDAPGRAHALNEFKNISPVAGQCKIVELPGLAEHGDVSDWFSAGGTVDEFNRLCMEAPEGIPHGWDLSEKSERLPATKTEKTIEALPLIRLSTVKAEPVSWQWNNRFPNKGLNLLAGMGEVGKTTVAAYMMSRLTTGRDWVDRPNTTPAGSCLFIGAEDDLGCAIRPKLDAAGADADKVVALDYEKFFEQGECFNLADHIQHLDKTIETIGDCRAIFFDPLNGYLGKVNAYSDSEARSVLIPLQNLAKKYDIAIYGLCHLNKKSDLSAVDRVLGSVAFVNTSRAVWFITWDKENDIRYLTCEKSNYSINPENLSFQIVDGAVSWFEGTTDKTATQVLQGGMQKSESTVECEAWLQKKLLNGSELSKDVGDQAKAMGFSEYALRESKRVLCVQSKKDTFNGKWRLYLPNPVEDDNDTF